MRRRFANAAFALTLAALPATAEPVTIAALGDSLTAGYGLPPEQGLVPQLQAWLDANGADVTLINAGVSGDTTAGGLARLDWTLTPDVDALIVTLGGNDMLRGLPPAEARANLDAILAKARDRALPVLLIGLTTLPNYGPDYQAEFNAVYPDLAKKYGTLYERNFFALIADTTPELLPLLQADGLHPSAEGVARAVIRLGPRIVELAALARSK
jgi:acyl-CoA thioesterase I